VSISPCGRFFALFSNPDPSASGAPGAPGQHALAQAAAVTQRDAPAGFYSRRRAHAAEAPPSNHTVSVFSARAPAVPLLTLTQPDGFSSSLAVWSQCGRFLALPGSKRSVAVPLRSLATPDGEPIATLQYDPALGGPAPLSQPALVSLPSCTAALFPPSAVPPRGDEPVVVLVATRVGFQAVELPV
jgi:hypothetical protein